jgi:YHS domain-containing protein
MITFTAILALALTAPAVHGDPLVCPVMGAAEANHEGPFRDYNGSRYWFCCEGCDAKFEKEPMKYTDLRAKGKAAGAFMFDPITGDRLTHDKAIEAFSDYKGVRFLFQNEANKAEFDKNPAKFGTMPKKEALYCPVGKEVVPSYAAASGFVDHDGVRYYMCCGGCETKFKAEPGKYLADAKKYVKTPGISTEVPKS